MPHPGGREDCWSEGGTDCLVEAWGDRYIQLSRGNLRQKDWSDVADAVNRRQELLGRPRRTDVQCKNRIDTVKKKYRLEKSKPGPSPWPLFEKLDFFVSATPPPSGAAVKNPRLPLLTFTVKPRNSNASPNPNIGGISGGSSSRFRSQTSSESSRTENDEEVDADDDDDAENRRLAGILSGGFVREKRTRDGLVECEKGRRRRRGRGRGIEKGGDLGQLARAITEFAEVYERVEGAKHQQMMELERHRMEFVKDLEFQRMKMFMEAQIEIEKMKVKQPKYSSGSGEKIGNPKFITFVG